MIVSDTLLVKWWWQGRGGLEFTYGMIDDRSVSPELELMLPQENLP